MGVDVDEARGDEQAVGVDLLGGGLRDRHLSLGTAEPEYRHVTLELTLHVAASARIGRRRDLGQVAAGLGGGLDHEEPADLAQVGEWRHPGRHTAFAFGFR